jgi:hypothetical protein
LEEKYGETQVYKMVLPPHLSHFLLLQNTHKATQLTILLEITSQHPNVDPKNARGHFPIARGHLSTRQQVMVLVVGFICSRTKVV